MNTKAVTEDADIVIVGAGAAGLMAGIQAGYQNLNRRIVLLDGAKRIGRKILISGGGRCNVTHHEVSERDYAGTSRNAIKKVLRRFNVKTTIEFFRNLGIELKQEETGKLFPVSNKAATVLEALLAEVKKQATIHHSCRVESIKKSGEQFVVSGAWGEIKTEKVVLATGGRSIPKTGSDGFGYQLAQSLGHTVTPQIFPALVPLKLPIDHFICVLKGITLHAEFELWSGSNKRLERFANSTLCTHFGLSGPAVLDISRYYIEAKGKDSQTKLTLNWIPAWSVEQLTQQLIENTSKNAYQLLRPHLPERLARTLVETLPEEMQDRPTNQISKSARNRFVEAVVRFPLAISGNRGFDFAEATAGGIPLTELNLKTMESRICPNLYLCGELCDVDGRIGGFNFQWAWSSGYTAGVSV